MTTTVAVDKEFVISVGTLLDTHKCLDVLVFDVAKSCDWTSYMAIASVSSMGHLGGVIKNLALLFDEKKIPFPLKKKGNDNQNWVFIDCGSIVIHLMLKETRDFYQLENMWKTNPLLFSNCE